MKRSAPKITRLSISFYLFLFITLVIFVALRLIHLPESIGFGSDAGRDFLAIWNLVHEKELTLIGPSSQYAFNGRYFYFGPAPYYIMMPALLIGNWDVLFAAKYLITLNALAFVISFLLLNKSLKQNEKFVMFAYAVFITVTPLLVNYSRTYWNPHFMLPISLLVISLLMWARSHALSPILGLILGILFGVGMQFHYSYVLAILLSTLILSLFRKFNKFNLLMMIIGFIIGFSPLILFELRNGFYNSHTFFLVFTNLGKESGSFGIPIYYLISLIPFICMAVAWILMKIYKSNSLTVLSILVIYSVISIAILIPIPTSGYDMAENWNYTYLKRTADIIINDNPENFNIVDQRTGDNRSMALRYRLTVKGEKPLGVTEYPQATTLYVFTHEPIEKILINPVWEISSSKTSVKTNQWNITDKSSLYKFEKEATLR